MKKLIYVCVFILFTLPVEAPHPYPVVYLQEVVVESKTYDREIFDTALELGADSLTARILVAQARFESAGYTNRLTRLHNNVFSMQHPLRRRTTSLGPLATAEGRPNTYASYNTLRDSVIDLFFYFEARNIDLRQPSINKYVYLLKSKAFFEEKLWKYQKGVHKYFNEINV